MQEEDVQEQRSLDARQKISAIVIANPTAGSYTQNAAQIEETITQLSEHGWDVALKLTEAQGDAGRLAREAVEQQIDVVIAVGGDGTINEVIQELAGSETALGVLPGGTVNVWARETGIPLDIVQAREVLMHGQMRRVDLGKVNDRYFLLMATIGFDAEVTHSVERKPIKRFGVLGYILMGTWLGLGYPNFHAFLQQGGRAKRVRTLQIVFGNTQLYAGAIKFTWQAKCDDGLLDVCVVRSQNPFGRILVFADFLFGRKKRQQWVRYESSREIKVHTSVPVAIQVDGDPTGYTAQRGFPPTIFSVVPSALKVIVPNEIPEPIFTT
jgi:YegS/Rv2252/BmrU family lipid kinase